MGKIIITGINGFTGNHLVRYLKNQKNLEIVGIDQHVDAEINGYQIDLRHSNQLAQIFGAEKPDYLVHLAGINKAETFSDFYEGNVFTTINILESIVEADIPATRILLISTSAVYGRAKHKLVDEKSILHPVNFYGNSKLSMENAARQYIENFNLKINIVRPFNLIGPGQSTEFALPSFIMQLLEIKYQKRRAVIKTGDLSGKRDFIDVQDAISGYWKILTQTGSGEIFNIGSGRSVSIQDVLNKIIEIVGVNVEQEVDEKRIQKNQILELVSNNRKLESLGWQQKKSLDITLKEMITFYEEKYFKINERN